MNTTIETKIPDKEEYQSVEFIDSVGEVVDYVDAPDTVLEKNDQDLLPKEKLVYVVLDENQCENTAGEQLLLLNDVQTYNCSDCNITFTSIEDHIQEYHQNQAILLAMSADEDEGNNESPYLLNITEIDNVTEANENILLNSEVAESKSESPDLLNVVDNENCIDDKDDLFDRVVVKVKGSYDDISIEDDDSGIAHVYQCSQCLNNFQTESDFNKHKCAKDKYKCIHCSVTYNNSKSLCAHMKVHKNLKVANEIPIKSQTGNSKDSVICEICETVFASKKSLFLHMRMHKPVKIRSVEAPVSRNPDSKGEQFYCFHCDKWMHLEYKTIHEEMHDGHVEFSCKICNKVFSSQEDLIMHSKAHSKEIVKSKKNNDSFNYECKYCGKKFAKPHEKVKHERIHTGEKPYSCEVCGKCFRVAYCLTVHLRTHTGVRPYVCKICNKRFKSFTVFNHHMPTHFNERPYKCPSCPKAFKTLVQLGGHKKSHTKPFQCTICNRPFSSLYAVKNHMSVHNKPNNMKFSCKYCGANYARFFALKDHIIQTHDVDKDILEATLKEEFLVSS